MNLCPFCGAPLPEGSRFCPRCGASVAELTPPAAPEPPVFGSRENNEPAPGAPIPAETALVPTAPPPEPAGPMDPEKSPAFRALRMRLHQESKAWRFFAIGVLVIMMGFAGLSLTIGGLSGLALTDADRDYAAGGLFMAGFFTVYGLSMTLTMLPVVIMGFVMGSKVHRYWEEAASDCGNALKHAGSVGVIVLAGFFSLPALIFIIINFVNTKRNRAELEAVLAWQKGRKPVAFHG